MSCISRFSKAKRIKVTAFSNNSRHGAVTKFMKTSLPSASLPAASSSSLPVQSSNISSEPPYYNEAGELPSSSYSQKRLDNENEWNDVRLHFQKAYLEGLVSRTKCVQCGSCLSMNEFQLQPSYDTNLQQAIICDDCGVDVSYCSDCCQRLHRFIRFHVPKIWQLP